jgi:hypothetical protein
VPIALWIAAIAVIYLNRCPKVKNLSELPNGRYILKGSRFGKKNLLRLEDSSGKEHEVLSESGEFPPPIFVLCNGKINDTSPRPQKRNSKCISQ